MYVYTVYAYARSYFFYSFCTVAKFLCGWPDITGWTMPIGYTKKTMWKCRLAKIIKNLHTVWVKANENKSFFYAFLLLFFFSVINEMVSPTSPWKFRLFLMCFIINRRWLPAIYIVLIIIWWKRSCNLLPMA